MEVLQFAVKNAKSWSSYPIRQTFQLKQVKAMKLLRYRGAFYEYAQLLKEKTVGHDRDTLQLLDKTAVALD